MRIKRPQNIRTKDMVHMNAKSSRYRLLSGLFNIVLSLLLVVSLLLMPALLGLGSSAYAVTSAEKRAEVDEAFERLDVLQTEINQLAVEYDAAVVARDDAEAKKRDAQAREEAARQRISVLQLQLGDRAKEMYRNGNNSFMDVLFGAQTFTDFITAFEMFSRVNERDAQLVRESKEAKAEAEEARIEFTEQEQVAREKQEEIERVKNEKEETEASLQEEIASLETELIEVLLREEIAREAAANNGSASYGTVTNEQMLRLSSLGIQYPFSSRQTISSGFGWRDFDNSFHLGTDFAAPGGTPVMAIAGGTVAAAGWHSLMGNYVIISHGSGMRSIYMHASGLNCRAGQAVSAGDVVCFVGTTGNSTGNHLHLQIEIDGRAVNPMLFM